MLSERSHSFENHDVSVILCKGRAYFKASNATSALGYVDSTQAIRKNVNKEYILTLSELHLEAMDDKLSAGQFIPEVGVGRSPLYISEPGINQLIMRSKKPEALRFQQWVVEEVLPEIRKTGRFVRNEQVSLMCETDLHYKVIDFVRKFFVEAIVVPGLGELQDTVEKRSDAWKKGYKGGQPDILILNRTRKASGLAIELKTPLCHRNPSENQEAFLQNLKSNKYEILLSNCYDEMIVKIIEYREAVRRCNPVRKVRSFGSTVE